MGNSRLRSGYTTGTCAAAASVAAWLRLCGHSEAIAVTVRFPDGENREIPVVAVDMDTEKDDPRATVVKDAGDDVDITDGARVNAHVCQIAEADIHESDFVFRQGESVVVLRGGAGVGHIKRPGLDVSPGKSAINPGPQQMILDTLNWHGLAQTEGVWLVSIGIDRGEQLAQKTLNPTLGIKGGLSILGRSGIVVPCSHKAYIDTIDVLLRAVRRIGQDTAVLVTGERTLKAASRDFPDIPENAFIRIGDFIQAALQACGSYGFRKVVIACMPGKLAKYARGIVYTHAHKAAQSMPAFVSFLQEEMKLRQLDVGPTSVRSVRELLSRLPANQQQRILDILTSRAIEALRDMVDQPLALEVIVYGYDGKRLMGAKDEQYDR